MRNERSQKACERQQFGVQPSYVVSQRVGEAMWDSKMFKAGIAVLLFFLIIYVGSQITFIFYPFVVAFEALFFSFLISGLLFYLTFPFVDLLHRYKLPRPVAILLIYLLAVGLLVLLGVTVGPVLEGEFIRLAENIPDTLEEAQKLLVSLEGTIFARLFQLDAINIDNIADSIAGSISRSLAQLATSLDALLGFISRILMTIIIVPFLFYYMLKEKGNAPVSGLVKRFAPPDYVEEINKTLGEMNKLLGSYVQGLAIVCFCVGILAYIGFLIIGLEYAMILSVFIMITNIVPFLGPFIGAIPVLIVGLLASPLMMLQVGIVIFIVQQMESLLISPQVLGRKLNLSPLAIILVVLIAGRLGGLLGIVLAVPIFTMLKIISTHLYEHIQLKEGM
jgi:predicted PurR-regulated permease PerM